MYGLSSAIEGRSFMLEDMMYNVVDCATKEPFLGKQFLVTKFIVL